MSETQKSLPLRAKYRPITCPKCRRVMYVTCSNRKCSCWRSVRRHSKPLRWMRDGERQKCPYCSFSAHADYWFERELSRNPIPWRSRRGRTTEKPLFRNVINRKAQR